MDYLKVQVPVLLLRSIAPLSILYSAIQLLQPVLPQLFHALRLPRPLAYWLFAEASTYIFLYLPYKHWLLQQPATHPAPLPAEERELLFSRCLDTLTDPERYLSHWFRGAVAKDIQRENVREWIHWAFFNAEHVEEQDAEEVDAYLEKLEHRLGRSLPPGRGSAVSLRTTLDPVHCTYRSLLWYFIIGSVDGMTHCSMLYHGFEHRRTPITSFWGVLPLRPLALLSNKRSPAKSLSYWHREHKSKDRLPVLFIHGVGIGLHPYTNLLRDINCNNVCYDKNERIGIIALELMAVSSRITYQASNKEALVNAIHNILNYHGWKKCILVGHSYGTVISTHLLKSPQTAHLIGPVILIDPIGFLLHLPDVAYNFTARQPTHAMELVLWYFASMDLGIAHTLGRRFFWSENVLWKEDLWRDDVPESGFRDITVVLSGRDDIVNVNAVRAYLTETNETIDGMDDLSWQGHGLDVIWFDKLHHAQVFDYRSTRGYLVKFIRTYSEQGVNDSSTL